MSRTRWLRRVVFGRPEGVRRRVGRWVWRALRPGGVDAPTDLATGDPHPGGTREDRAPEPGEASDLPVENEGWIATIPVDEVAPGAIVEVIVAGRAVALVNVDGRVHAITATCPHAGGPLADGTLDGGVLTCPVHGWTFEVETGACLVDPSHPLERWEARVDAGRVWVRSS